MQFTTGERIAKARKAAGLSQKDLADALEISQAQVSNFERNTPEAHQKWCRRIASICSVPVSMLLDTTDDAGSRV